MIRVFGNVELEHVLDADPRDRQPGELQLMVRQLVYAEPLGLASNDRCIAVVWLETLRMGQVMVGITIGTPARRHLAALVRFARLTLPKFVEALMPEARVLVALTETVKGERIARLCGFSETIQFGPFRQFERKIGCSSF